jgi:asparagine synthase (glutamine-hydrolysing)
MCGIAGRVGPGGPAERDIVARMIGRLKHRGPDHQAIEQLDELATFGHARLSIVDLSPLGHQPMTDRTRRYTITYNGEIYNFQALRRELEQRGHVFVSRSDTEVLLNAYLEWGVAAFARLSGMFALAIWDAQEQELVLARDRFGEKPLYYALAANVVTFASELTALAEDPAILQRRRLSIAALNHYLAIGYILSPLTIYEDVFKLEPATYLRFRGGRQIETTRYWQYRDAFARVTRESEDDIERNLEQLFDGAVARMLVADVPVGAFLSGGVDSSAVVAFARRHLPYELHTFSVGFAEASYDESLDARLVADRLHTIHHEIRVESRDGRQLAERSIDCYDEPFSDTSLVPMVEVAALAARRVKVALSGDGADEIFGGYLTYRADALHARLRRVPQPLRAAVAEAVQRMLGETRHKVGFAFKAKQFARGVGCDGELAHYKWRELHGESERIAILGARHAEEIRHSDPALVFRRYYREVDGLDPLSRHLYVDAKTWLVDDVLVKVDRATMASSLESRTPFLDQQLAEYVASIPSRLKIRGRLQKIILKRLLRRYLPAATLDKKKAGFNAPVNSWFGHGSENEFRFFNRLVLERWRARQGLAPGQ